MFKQALRWLMLAYLVWIYNQVPHKYPQLLLKSFH